jgi:hypothetical protein
MRIERESHNIFKRKEVERERRENQERRNLKLEEKGIRGSKFQPR